MQQSSSQKSQQQLSSKKQSKNLHIFMLFFMVSMIILLVACFRLEFEISRNASSNIDVFSTGQIKDPQFRDKHKSNFNINHQIQSIYSHNFRLRQVKINQKTRFLMLAQKQQKNADEYKIFSQNINDLTQKYQQQKIIVKSQKLSEQQQKNMGLKQKIHQVKEIKDSQQKIQQNSDLSQQTLQINKARKNSNLNIDINIRDKTCKQNKSSRRSNELI